MTAPAQLEPVRCTGLTASWCPVHGMCTCDRNQDLDDDDCPLHRWDSDHPFGGGQPNGRNLPEDVE